MAVAAMEAAAMEALSRVGPNDSDAVQKVGRRLELRQLSDVVIELTGTKRVSLYLAVALTALALTVSIPGNLQREC